jgi:hypothetical protein
VTTLDPRAVQDIAAEMTPAVADLIGWLTYEHGRYSAQALADPRLGFPLHICDADVVDQLATLTRRTETGQILGQGDVYTDDHDLTASEFTAITTADPFGYLEAAAELVAATAREGAR